jgi:tRNA U34 5-carboxymethylaminomethyl modifying enzyme MnmG/GidA
MSCNPAMGGIAKVKLLEIDALADTQNCFWPNISVQDA